MEACGRLATRRDGGRAGALPRVRGRETEHPGDVNLARVNTNARSKTEAGKNTTAEKWFRGEPLPTSSCEWQAASMASLGGFGRALYNTDRRTLPDAHRPRPHQELLTSRQRGRAPALPVGCVTSGNYLIGTCRSESAGLTRQETCLGLLFSKGRGDVRLTV